MMGGWRKDLSYAVRALRRRPLLVGAATLTLALGLGAASSVYTVVDQVLLRAAPYFGGTELLWGIEEEAPNSLQGASWPDYLDFKERLSSFESLVAYQTGPGNLPAQGEARPSQITVGFVDPGLFELAGVQPQLGRPLTPADDEVGAVPVVVLSHTLWQERFGGRPDVIGASLPMDSLTYEVVGVLPRDQPLGQTEAWTALAPYVRPFRGVHGLTVLGRIRDGVGREDALAEVQAVAAQLAEEYPDDNARRTATLQPYQAAVVGGANTPLLFALGAVGVVLLLVCGNVAHLLLVVGASRDGEWAVRSALGAGRKRLVRQMLLESTLLAGVGLAGGLALAWVTVRALVEAAPAAIPRIEEVSLDLRVIGVMLVITLGVALLAGIVPALRIGRTDPAAAISQAGDRRASRRRSGTLLVVGEVALATTLLITSGLLVRSFQAVADVDPGVNTEGLVAVTLNPGFAFPDTEGILAFWDAVVTEVGNVPGVQAVNVDQAHPLASSWTSSYALQGTAAAADVNATAPEARVRPIRPGYFDMMGIELVRGRDLSPDAELGGPGEVVVNEAFVRLELGDEEPVGRTIVKPSWWEDGPEEWTIVGVAEDTRFRGPVLEPDAAIYYPHAQFPFATMTLLIRVEGGAGGLPEAIRDAIWRVDGNVPVPAFTSVEAVREARVAPQRFNASVFGGFALAALVLAAIGIYGVMAWSVGRRTREFGIRLSLGAERWTILRDVLANGLALVGVGLAVGTVASILLGRYLDSLLFGVAPTDPVTLAGALAVLGAAGAAAALLPALRATRVDPVRALREE
jgi:predicted permease